MAGGFGHLGHLPQVLRAAPGRPERIEGTVGRDPVKPRAHRRALLERIKPAPRCEKGLLDQVLGILDRPDDPVNVNLKLTPVRVGQFTERILLAGACTLEGLVAHARILAPTVPFVRITVMTPGRPEIRRSISLAANASTDATPASSTKENQMGKIVISQNVTLDGVVEDPSGGEGFRHGGWFGQFIGEDWEAWAELELAETQGAEALLLGRRSDEYFANQSQHVSGEWVDNLNRLPKYVVSSKLQEPKWTNATVLSGDVVDAVSTLKGQTRGEIVVYGSRQLVHTLMEHDLVDEMRLLVFPVLLGAGEPLFGETSDKRPLRLIHTQTVGNGLVHLTYERAR